MADEWTIIMADRVVDGAGGQPINDGVVVIMNDVIQAVGAYTSVTLPTGPNVETIRATPGKTIVPGLVDVHSHLVMPGDGTPYQAFMQHDDGILLMQAAKNAITHLRSGVTTLADTGSRNMVSFTLRDAIGLGLATGPRLIVCGRPLTRTGGHCWFLGGEADGVQGISAAARQVLKEGADIIKVMATGGGTAGTFPHRPALTTDELTVAVHEAHELGKKAIAHTTATAGTVRSLDANFDVLFHCHFYEPDGTLLYQDELARRIADCPVYVNPTLWVNGVHVDVLGRKAESEGLCDEEKKELNRRTDRYAGQRENVGRLVRHGVRMIAGSDAGWGRYPFGDLVTELEQMVEVGLSASEVLASATSQAAKALGVDSEVGTLTVGKKADLLLVDGDPTADISTLRNVELVMLGGKIVQ